MDYKRHHIGPLKMNFIKATLQCLSKDLWEKLGVPLLFREANSSNEVSSILQQVIHELKITDLYFNSEYEVDESKRDEEIIKKLSIKVHRFEDQCVVLPNTLKAKSSNNGTFEIDISIHNLFIL